MIHSEGHPVYKWIYRTYILNSFRELYLYDTLWKTSCLHWIYTVADLHSKILDARPPPPGPKFFQFHAVFGKIWQNRMLAPPPGELAPPPRGNPRSATATGFIILTPYLALFAQLSEGRFYVLLNSDNTQKHTVQTPYPKYWRPSY